MAKLTDKQVDDYIKSQKGFKSQAQKDDLIKKSETVWFRQYVRKSKERLVKITAKLKKQIKQGKGTYFSEGRNPEEGNWWDGDTIAKAIRSLLTKRGQGINFNFKAKEKERGMSDKPESQFCLKCFDYHEPYKPTPNHAWQWGAKDGHALRSAEYMREENPQDFIKLLRDVILDDVPHKYQKRLLEFFK